MTSSRTGHLHPGLSPNPRSPPPARLAEAPSQGSLLARGGAAPRRRQCPVAAGSARGCPCPQTAHLRHPSDGDKMALCLTRISTCMGSFAPAALAGLPAGSFTGRKAYTDPLLKTGFSGRATGPPRQAAKGFLRLLPGRSPKHFSGTRGFLHTSPKNRAAIFSSNKHI